MGMVLRVGPRRDTGRAGPDDADRVVERLYRVSPDEMRFSSITVIPN